MSKWIAWCVGVGFAVLTGCGDGGQETGSGEAQVVAGGKAAAPVAPKTEPPPPAAEPLPHHSGDSAWLVCNSSLLALNVFEHRTQDPLKRATDYVLLWGGHTLTGSVEDDAQDATLKNAGGSTFAGTIKVDFAAAAVVAKGTLTLVGTPFAVSDTMKCTTM